jgi:magnesium transporter
MPEPLTRDDLQDPVTKHMRTDFVQLNAGQTVGQALETLIEKQPEGRIIYFYVTDDDGRLQGVVPTRRLLLTPRDRPLADVMVRRVVALPDSATVLDACEFFVMHRLLAFPVVDAGRRLLGLVDVDLYTAERADLDEREERHDDLFQLIGVHLTEAQQASPLLSFRRRFPWLLTNVAGGVVAAFLAGLFEAELQKAVALALFIPVVLALAESVSIQSVSLALQTLHGRTPTVATLLPRLDGRTPTVATLLPRLGRELLTGAFLGAACGALVGGVVLLWLQQAGVMACVAGGIAGGIAVAAAVGLAMPNLLRMFRLDPQVAAGPIALAAADMLTLLLYFNLARWLLG